MRAGPLVALLAQRGIEAVGIDVAPGAVESTRHRGGDALVRSVFEPLPNEGGWHTALLFDGNVGIGGDPEQLFDRLGSVLAPGGTIVAELGGPGSRRRKDLVRLEGQAGTSGWFPWAWLGVDDVEAAAATAGLVTTSTMRSRTAISSCSRCRRRRDSSLSAGPFGRSVWSLD